MKSLDYWRASLLQIESRRSSALTNRRTLNVGFIHLERSFYSIRLQMNQLVFFLSSLHCVLLPIHVSVLFIRFARWTLCHAIDRWFSRTIYYCGKVFDNIEYRKSQLRLWVEETFLSSTSSTAWFKRKQKAEHSQTTKGCRTDEDGNTSFQIGVGSDQSSRNAHHSVADRKSVV